MTTPISAENKPLPVITDQTRPFWTAAKEGRLVLQKCGKCGTFQFQPKPWCIECGSRDLAWSPAKPTGTVYTFTISRSVAMNFPGWEPELPVLMCLIDLDDGARVAELFEERARVFEQLAAVRIFDLEEHASEREARLGGGGSVAREVGADHGFLERFDLRPAREPRNDVAVAGHRRKKIGRAARHAR